MILLCAADRGRTGGRILKELRNDALKGKSTFPKMLSEALAMVDDYSAMVTTTQTTKGYEGAALAQEEAILTTFTKRRGKESSAGGSLTQQHGGKTRKNSGVTCHLFQNNDNYSYSCQYPAPTPRDNAAIMHLNSTVDDDTDIPQEPSYEVPEFYFLNLEYGSKANYFLGDEADTNEGNTYANIE